MKHIDWSLTLVTDSKLIGFQNLENFVREAVLGGVSIVQLRDKHCSDEDFVKRAKSLKALLKPLGIPLIINDRVHIAKDVDADGVHIGQSDRSYLEVRRELGSDKIIGLSVENFEQAAIAQSYDLDYLGVSPLFKTPTKPELSNEWGLRGLKELRDRSKHKLICIGGIHLENLKEVLAHGADGIAVVSEICASSDPRNAARKLRDAMGLAIRKKRPSRVLTIACSDSGGGAGVEADLKTISATGSYAMTCFTALSAQNTCTVEDFHPVPPRFVRSQLEAVLKDIGVDAVKIGVVHNPETISVIAETLQEYGVKNIVLDTVMISKSGHKFVDEDAISAFKQHLFPIASVITPNLPEASDLLARPLHTFEDRREAARALLALGPKTVLIKGGHADECVSTDLLMWKEGGVFKERLYESRRVYTPNTHGTGCSLSSAIASYLAQGSHTPDAVAKAKTFISNAIEAGQFYKIGSGHGPIHHFFERF